MEELPMYNELIFQDAVSGLTEYYPCLMDESLVGEFESCIKYPKARLVLA